MLHPVLFCAKFLPFLLSLHLVSEQRRIFILTGTEDLSPLTPGINCSEIDGCESDPCFNDGITPATCKDIPWSKLSPGAPPDKVWITCRKFMYSCFWY